MKQPVAIHLVLIAALLIFNGSAHCEATEGMPGAWAEKVSLSGLIEVETGYENLDPDTGSNEESSDIVLATVELGIDADIVKHVSGHILFLYEEDETDLEVDEGIITIDGEDVVPLFISAGQMYVPFGNFNSHFISDPLTLELGETRESAVTAGVHNDYFEISATAFNGDIEKTGDDDMIQTYIINTLFSLPEDRVPNLSLSAGVAYLSNIADSDTLQDQDGVNMASIAEHIDGVSSFISLSIFERFFLEGEFVGALKSFEAGELDFDGGRKMAPKTWNIEAAVAIIEGLEIATKYEGSDDCGALFPEAQFGGVVSAELFEHTFLGVEYLYGKFKNDDERQLLTLQLALEF